MNTVNKYRLTTILHSDSHWRHSSSTSISVLQRGRGVTIMRYINLHFTYFYLLTTVRTCVRTSAFCALKYKGMTFLTLLNHFSTRSRVQRAHKCYNEVCQSAQISTFQLALMVPDFTIYIKISKFFREDLQSPDCRTRRRYYPYFSLTENAGVENEGGPKTQDWNTQEDVMECWLWC